MGAGVGNTSTSTTGLSIVDCTIGNNSAGHGGAQLYFSSVADVLVAGSSWDMTANNTQVVASLASNITIAGSSVFTCAQAANFVDAYGGLYGNKSYPQTTNWCTTAFENKILVSSPCPSCAPPASSASTPSTLATATAPRASPTPSPATPAPLAAPAQTAW